MDCLKSSELVTQCKDQTVMQVISARGQDSAQRGSALHRFSAGMVASLPRVD